MFGSAGVIYLFMSVSVYRLSLVLSHMMKMKRISLSLSPTFFGQLNSSSTSNMSNQAANDDRLRSNVVSQVMIPILCDQLRSTQLALFEARSEIAEKDVDLADSLTALRYSVQALHLASSLRRDMVEENKLLKRLLYACLAVMVVMGGISLFLNGECVLGTKK